MIQLITADYYGDFIDAVTEMHRLRYRVFKNRLDWVSRSVEIWRSTNSTRSVLPICYREATMVASKAA